ncbi:UNVERIFIED_CONTAM: Ubiquitin carboxyl-terminal hydrolase 10 [Sesamum indicum]
MTIPDSSSYHYMMENGSLELPCKPEEEKRIVQELTDKAEANLHKRFTHLGSRTPQLDLLLIMPEGRGTYILVNAISVQELSSFLADLLGDAKVELDMKKFIEELRQIPPPLNVNSAYACKQKWFKAWQRYTGKIEDGYPFEGHSTESQSATPSNIEGRPGPIDNNDIVVNEVENKDDGPQLLRTLEEGRDYVLVPQEVWQKLLKCKFLLSPRHKEKDFSRDNGRGQPTACCLYKGGPVLPRKMISVGDQHKQFIVEDSVHNLYEKVCLLKGLDTEKACIWDYFNKQKHTILISSNQTLEESNLQMDQDILLEVAIDGSQKCLTGNSLALVQVEPIKSTSSIAGDPNMDDGYESLKSVTRGDKGGLAGLQNLGNTCFMNSALQCLVHTPHLAQYFLQDYSDEINRQNPLGMHGELALAFGDLLRKLWSSGRTPVAPRAFKGKLARFAPQFSGYNQHDSQELLAFLLDGLHEDLNRVKQKPYIETKDYDGRPDEEVADEFWRYHKARNDSIIVDICQGQYKSTLVCPVCNKISITFDPFMYLSLPLPSTTTRSMTATVFYGDGSGLPMPFTVTLPKQGCCKDLNQALGIACCLQDDEYLLLAEVYEHRIYRYLEIPSEPLATIKDDEHIVAYRLPKTEAKFTRLEIWHRYQENERKLFLTPLVTVLEDPKSGCDVDLAVNKVLSPLRRKGLFTSTATDSSNENGPPSSATEEQTNGCSSQFGPATQSTEGMEPEGMSSKELSFRLCVTDDKGYGCQPIVKDSPIQPSRLIKVMLDWTEKEHELYDASYLKDLPEVHKSGLLAKKTKQEVISLFSCLDAFLKEEPLGPDDMWYCPRCKEHRQASKKLDLWRLPDVLVFHLKRFSYSRWLKNKLDTFVNFPIHDLDLSKYVKSKDASEGSHVYELYAISNHYGGLGGGHYSAYCKVTPYAGLNLELKYSVLLMIISVLRDLELVMTALIALLLVLFFMTELRFYHIFLQLIDENRWYHFDDSHVSSVNESEIKTSAAYVLFYQRVKHTSEGAWGGPATAKGEGGRGGAEDGEGGADWGGDWGVGGSSDEMGEVGAGWAADWWGSGGEWWIGGYEEEEKLKKEDDDSKVNKATESAFS